MVEHSAPTFTAQAAIIGGVSYVVLAIIIATPFIF